MKRIELPIFGVVVVVDGPGSGTITSDLHDDGNGGDHEDQYDAAMHALESVILGHACAGIDITSPAYLEGIETAVDACGNHFS